MDGSGSRHSRFPTAAAILFGLGLGGFFDGSVRHQILQGHHMLTSAGYPADSVGNLKANTLGDGLFHASTSLVTLAGLFILGRDARQNHIRWSGLLLPGGILMGFGIFKLVEGTVDHHLRGLHHVNETVPRETWIYWDVGFLLWGAAMLIGGWAMLRQGQASTRAKAASKPLWTAKITPD